MSIARPLTLKCNPDDTEVSNTPLGNIDNYENIFEMFLKIFKYFGRLGLDIRVRAFQDLPVFYHLPCLGLLLYSLRNEFNSRD